MWKYCGFYYGTSLVDIYFTRNTGNAGVDCEGGCWDISHLGGTDSFFFQRYEKRLRSYCKKKMRTERGEEISKTQTAFHEYITSIPLHIHSHSSPESHIHTLACLRRRIIHNHNVNMIIVYGGRVHKSHHNFA